MSQENVEVVRACFRAFAEEGPAGVLDLVASDVEWNVRPDLPDSTTYRGPDGMRALFATFEEVMEDQWYEPQDFISKGEQIVVPLRWGGRGKQSGAVFEDRAETWVFTVRGGRIARVEEYATKEAALEATGLSKQGDVAGER